MSALREKQRRLLGLVALQMVWVAWLSSGIASMSSIAHSMLVSMQNLISLQHPLSFPAAHSTEASCEHRLQEVALLTNVMPPMVFAHTRRVLPEAVRQRGLKYATNGRRSYVLAAAELIAVAPELRDELHQSPAWRTRLSAAIGKAVYPLDERRFRMALAAQHYRTGSYNAPHRDSRRTESTVWMVVLGIDNNSTSQLIIDGEPCTVPENAALIFSGEKRLHWVPILQPEAGGDVQRTIVTLEYTEEPPERVRWSWPWHRTLFDVERIFLH